MSSVRRILALLAILLIIPLPVHAQDDVFKRIENRSAVIYNATRGSACSAVNLSTLVMITAAHCVDSDKDLFLAESADGTWESFATAFYIDEGFDLALLIVKNPRVGIDVLTDSAPPVVGQKVWVGAFEGKPSSWSIEFGTILEVDDKAYLVPCNVPDASKKSVPHQQFVTSNAFRAGNSGGGMWDDRGALIGIAVATRYEGIGCDEPIEKATEIHGVAIGSSTVIQFILKATKDLK